MQPSNGNFHAAGQNGLSSIGVCFLSIRCDSLISGLGSSGIICYFCGPSLGETCSTVLVQRALTV